METLGALLVLAGAAFMAVSALGIVRLPDVLTRMHAATKAATLGTGLLTAAIAVLHPQLGVISRAVAFLIVVVLTGPVGAHVLARATYYARIPLWKGTWIDELRGHDPTPPEAPASPEPPAPPTP